MTRFFSQGFRKTSYGLLIAASCLGLSACDTWFGEKEKPPLPGQRINALDYEHALRPESTASTPAYQAAAQMQNSDWAQVGGNAAHNYKNLALSSGALQKIWTADIGTGTRKRFPLTAQPVVAGQSIYTLDTESSLRAFDTQSGDLRWKTDVADPTEDDEVISGGIAYEGGFVYVTAGYDEILCVEAATGNIAWRAKIPAPSRAAPAIKNGRVYVTTLNNATIALNAKDGSKVWDFSGIDAQTGLVGAASPAVTDDMVIPVFSSGEIYALRAINGSVVWSDNLASSLRLGGLTAVADIRGLPVVDGTTAYAISYGGKMAAIDLITGSRQWQKEISGSKTPLVSGNRVFVISSKAEIIALDKDSGTIVWMAQLARYGNKEERSNPIFWEGPIMAGDRLIALSSDGRMAEIDAEKGTLIRETRTGDDIRTPLIVADGVLYTLAEDGTLTAWK